MSSADKSAVWFAVINVYAASNKAVKSWTKAEERMKAKGMVFHGSRTGKGGNAIELTFDACMAGYRKFIAVGGDGTVHDVLNGIAGYVDWAMESGRPATFSDFTIGVIPVGSGNDWIKNAGADYALLVGSVAQDSYSIGYKAVELAAKKLAGETVADVGIAGVWYNAENIDEQRDKNIFYMG